jgi:hypothetical protein
MCRTHSVEEDITGKLVFSLVSVTLNTWQDITGNLVFSLVSVTLTKHLAGHHGQLGEAGGAD